MSAEVKAIVAEVLAQQAVLHHNELDLAVGKAIANILQSFGIEEEDKKELRADFIHLRKWRKSVDAATGLSFKVMITALISGVLGAFWLGFKTILGK